VRYDTPQGIFGPRQSPDASSPQCFNRHQQTVERGEALPTNAMSSTMGDKPMFKLFGKKSVTFGLIALFLAGPCLGIGPNGCVDGYCPMPVASGDNNDEEREVENQEEVSTQES
tara:strand:- start:42247 stop:42588 length:342 start_codon:yes stop_codon:yes gene_type:complete